MKMKQKGIATAAIAVVVIVVIAVAGVGAFLVLRGGGGGGVGGLPVYTGATKCDTIGTMGTPSNFVKTMSGSTADLPSDVTAEAYTATGSVSDVLSYYRTQMSGWTTKYDNTFSWSYLTLSYSVGLLYFEKADRAAVVCAVSYTYEGESYLYFVLAEGPKTVFDTWMTGAGYEWETPGGETPGGGGVGSATSLDYKVDMIAAGQTVYTYRWRAKNIGTASMDMRYDMTSEGTTVSYIISGSQQKVWYGADSQWTDFSQIPGYNFSDYWDTNYDSFQGYVDELSGWTTGEQTYSYGGYTIKIYDILLNPTLGDEVFTPS